MPLKENSRSSLDLVPNPDPTLRTIEVVDKAIESLIKQLEPKFEAIEARFQERDNAAKLLHEDFVRVPTVVDRAIINLRELMESKIEGRYNHVLAKIDDVQTTIDGMDKALVLLQTYNDKMPDFVRNEVGQLKKVHEEKIDGSREVVNERIKSLADVTTQQFASINDKFAEKDKAVSVGLSAQKESAAATQDSNTAATNKMEANFTALLQQQRELLAEVRKSTEQQMNDMKTTMVTLGSRLDRGEGRSSVADPTTTEQIRQLALSVQGLATSRDSGTGQSHGVSVAVAAIIGFFALLASIASIGAFIMSFSNSAVLDSRKAAIFDDRVTINPPRQKQLQQQ
jgi:hypothetical protein